MDMPKFSSDAQYPDWELIDEISIPLLEQGIGTFDTLQRSLPSIVLPKVERLDGEWTEQRLVKMFRISQMQIRYILQSQQELLTKLDAEKEKTKKILKENSQFRKSFTHRDTPRELFKCGECSKIFLHSSFLCDHIQRKHGGDEQKASTVAARPATASTSTSIWR